MQPSKANILVVDDREDKLLAFSAILSELNQNVICASSGKDALRCLLHTEVAVILLDVNMPGMDGFETATTIRQRKNLEHIPIIFITSSSDHENHSFRGYQLGAVDYILAPVVPEVLRTKVGVFVELYKKNQQLAQQAANLQVHASRLQKLMEASLAINSALSLDRVLQLVTDTAREVVDAEQAIIKTVATQIWSRVNSFISSVDDGVPPISDMDWYTIYAMVCSKDRPLRMTAEEWSQFPARDQRSNDMRAWMAVPLTARNERSIGVLYVSRRNGPNFTDNDQVVLVQLAQMASVAIENSISYEAREANKMKDEFLATLSHELRTPLTSMLAWVSLLRSGTLDLPTTKRAMEVLDRNVRTQKRLIDDLLDVSRIITGKLSLNIKPVDLHAIMEALLDAFKLGAETKKVAVHAELSRDVPKILGDPERLQQAIGNVIGNAIKFTPPGGRVDVRLAMVNSKIEIAVADTGRGILPDHLPYIFDKFRQADSTSTRSEGGLGLGLAIVRHLIDLHGGQVAANSPGEGQGATFTFTLPIIALRLDQAGAPPGPALAPPVLRIHSLIDLSGTKIVVVDDDADSRDAIVQVLQASNAQVLSAGSAQEGMTLLKADKPNVLISDIGMPFEDGYTFIGRVREMERDSSTKVPAIALTAYARDEDRARALAAGFQMHLSKPVEPAELISAVASLGGVLRITNGSAAAKEPVPQPTNVINK